MNDRGRTTLKNPFTPSLIAGNPEQFFGRQPELEELERSLALGSVAITGGIGIGKSSLLARGLAKMEGFAGPNSARSVLTSGLRDIQTVDVMARRLLERFVGIDEKHRSVKFSLGSVLEIGSTEIVSFFKEGRHLDALQRVLEADYAQQLLKADQLLLLSIDEADKCPIPIARLVRSIVTHTQHEGITNVRFILAGASPFFHQMVREDRGIARFFYRIINLEPMSLEDAEDLVQTKLDQLVEDSERDGIELSYQQDVIEKILALSGGHPAILQLLGSHVVEHENSDPDGVIDSRDLFNSLRGICYGVRGPVYDDVIHDLDGQGKLEALQLLLAIGPGSPRNMVSSGFPTILDRRIAQEAVGHAVLQWFVEQDILAISGEHYRLVDEFLRVRLRFDHMDRIDERDTLERLVARDASDYKEETLDDLDGNVADGFSSTDDSDDEGR